MLISRYVPYQYTTRPGTSRLLPHCTLPPHQNAVADSRAHRRRGRALPGRSPSRDDGAGQHDLRAHGPHGRHPPRRAARHLGWRRQRAPPGRRPPPRGPPGPLRPRAAPPPPHLPRRLLRACRCRRRRRGAAVRAHRRGPYAGAHRPLRRVVRRLRAAAPPGRAGACVAAAPRRRARPRRPRGLRPRPQRGLRLRILRPGGDRGDDAGDGGGVKAVHGDAARPLQRRVRRGGHAGRRRGQLRLLHRHDHAPGHHHPGGHQLRPAQRCRDRTAHRRFDTSTRTRALLGHDIFIMANYRTQGKARSEEEFRQLGLTAGFTGFRAFYLDPFLAILEYLK